MKRFSTGKESDFTKPCKLTQQKYNIITNIEICVGERNWYRSGL